MLPFDGVPSEFHMIQDLLRISNVSFALTQPKVLSGSQILEFWRIAVFDDGGANGTPGFIFSHGDIKRVVTPNTIRAALNLLTHNDYMAMVSEKNMRQFLTLIGLAGALAKLGQLKSLHCARSGISTSIALQRLSPTSVQNFYDLPIMSQQIGFP